MITKKVLAKGQVVIPKAIRDMLGVNVGDEMVVDVEGGRIILSKKRDVVRVFSEVARTSGRRVEMAEIKHILEERYGGD
ncbi:MAG: AbrB/MazE/SpoVT family DNA-binding domain-containing protein [Thermoplasmata archaeon]|nr:AbrB/MazE/SpoVT family DNA-binding domain-containing protein [Thermoplasmata archaeon]